MRRAVVAVVLASLVAGPGCSSSDDTDGTSVRGVSTSAPARGGSGATTGPGGDSGGGAVVPGEDWVVADPADHGIDPDLLEEARDYAFGDGMHTQGVVVVHRGEVVAEWYADGADAETPAASWSMAKGLTSAAVGIAIDQGLIPDVDEPLSTYLGAWAGTERADITVRDALQMSSGLDWDETYELETAGESEVIQMVTAQRDQLAFVAARPLAHPPGTRFNYSSGESMLLSGALEEATGRTLGDYVQEELFDRIGVGPVDWWRDAEGHTLGYCCIDATTRDFARVGLLYERRGRWGDEQVVPSGWIDDTVTPASTAEQGQYGYHWWLDDPEGVPEDHFYAYGLDHQYIHVIPSLDLVVVRNGTYVKDPGPPVADPNLFAHYPANGLVPGAGTIAPDEWDKAAFLGPIVRAVEGA
jgi:CubicO group peptidase (beta-lactamase class C family)